MNTYPAGKLPHAELGRLLAAYTHHHEHLLVPPTLGEDAAVIEFGDRLLVVKTDPITFATDQIGWYAVHVNANDIAAMGAVPRFFLSTILLPARQATPALAESIFRSIYEAATSLDIVVCGGHSEITHGIDRPLVRIGDFERFAGHHAKVKTGRPINGRKRFQGRLLGVTGDAVRLEDGDTAIDLPYPDIERAALVLTEELTPSSKED